MLFQAFFQFLVFRSAWTNTVGGSEILHRPFLSGHLKGFFKLHFLQRSARGPSSKFHLKRLPAKLDKKNGRIFAKIGIFTFQFHSLDSHPLFLRVKSFVRWFLFGYLVGGFNPSEKY